jgi:hypothetical protein
MKTIIKIALIALLMVSCNTVPEPEKISIAVYKTQITYTSPNSRLNGTILTTSFIVDDYYSIEEAKYYYKDDVEEYFNERVLYPVDGVNCAFKFSTTYTFKKI